MRFPKDAVDEARRKTLETGSPGEVLTAAGWRKPQRTCSVAGCTAAHVSKGLCRRHRSQVERHGRLTPELERRPRPCLAPTCDGRRAELGPYCRKHARQERLHGRLTPERERVVGWVGCVVDGCDGKHRAKKLCARHYHAARCRRKKAARA